MSPLPADLEDVVINNRLRREIGSAMAGLKLTSPDRAVRLAAAKELQNGADEDLAAGDQHSGGQGIRRRDQGHAADDAGVDPIEQHRQGDAPGGSARARREQSVEHQDACCSACSRKRTASRSNRMPRCAPRPRKPCIRCRADLSTGEMVGRVFSGISLGSILLLAALGLAITYGLMGVINMAHGELIMIGAYTTYMVQNAFRAHIPAFFDAYLIAAVPVSFAVSALVGMVLERTVIRFLYGRPLETLLATWGISLILMQTVRTIFGAQNVPVENPSWMSGGIEAITGVVLPWSRIVIIGFAAAVLAADLAAAHAHAPRTVRARRDAEPRHGELHRRSDRARRHVGVRPGLGACRARGLRAVADRQRRPRPRPELHRRLVHGRRAGRRRPARGNRVRGDGPRHRQQVPRGVVRRGARQDRGARVHHHLHPEAAARVVRAEGQDRGG